MNNQIDFRVVALGICNGTYSPCEYYARICAFIGA